MSDLRTKIAERRAALGLREQIAARRAKLGRMKIESSATEGGVAPPVDEAYIRRLREGPGMRDQVGAAGAGAVHGVSESVTGLAAATGLVSERLIPGWAQAASPALKMAAGLAQPARIAQEAVEKAIPAPEGTREGLPYQASRMLGLGAGAVGQAALTGGVAGLAGRTGLAGVEAAGVSPRAVTGAVLGQSALSGAALQGEVAYFTAKAEGADDDTAWKAFLLNAPVGGAAGALVTPKIISRLVPGLRGSSAADVLLWGGAAGAGQIAWEDHVAQELLKYREDKPFLENVVAAAKGGAFGALSAGILHAATGVVSGRVQSAKTDVARPAPPEGREPIPTPEDAVRAAEPVVESTGTAPGPGEAPATPEPATARAVEGAAPESEQPPVMVGGGKGESAEVVPPQEPPAQEQRAAAPSERKAVGIKNAEVDKDLAEMGFEPAPHGESTTNQTEAEKAAAVMERDPRAGEKLVNSLLAEPRTLETEDVALLLHERNRLENESRNAENALADARESGVGIEAAEARANKAVEDIVRLAETATVGGTKQAQAFQLRQRLMREDFSLEAIVRRRRMSKGMPLSAEERAWAKVTAEKIAKLEADVRALEEARMTEEAKARVTEAVREPRKRVPRGAVRSWLHTEAEAARARMKARLVTTSAGIDPTMLYDLSVIGAEHIADGIVEFGAWSKRMVADLGENVTPHLKEAYEAAKAYKPDVRLLVARGKEGGDLGKIAHEIALALNRPGMSAEDLTAAVHPYLKEIRSGITEAETMDAISGYGKFRQLSKEEAKVQLRQRVGEMQQLGKLRDLENRLPPKKTGMEHREPSPRERRLIKQYNELRRKLGIRTTDPETQLRGALESLKTRLKNQIQDLQHEIDTGQRTVKDRTPLERDTEAKALEAQRDALKAQHEEIFGEPPKTEEQKQVAALEKQIAVLDQRLKTGDLSPRRTTKHTVDTKAVSEARARRDALSAQLEALRKPKPPTQEEIDARRVQTAIKTTEKQIAEYERRIAAGEVKAKERPAGPTSPELDAVRARRDALSAQLDELRSLAEPKATPEERATKAAMARLAHEKARLQERLMYEDFIPRTRSEPRPLSQEEISARAELQTLKDEVRRGEMKYREENRTLRQRIKDYALEPPRLMRAVWSSFDLSAFFRQGLPFTFGHPVEAIQAGRKMVRAARSEKYAQMIDAETRNSPAGKLFLATGEDLTHWGDTLGVHEEAIRSRLSDKIPGIKASNRAFTTYLNIARVQIYDHMLRSAAAQPTVTEAKVLGSAIATGLGRGATGKGRFAATVSAAGEVLWSPRLLLSRFQLLSGHPMWKPGNTAQTRKLILKEIYVRPLMGIAAMYALVRMSGLGDVEWDPRSSDFGKIRIGNTRIDPMAGLLQVSRLAPTVGFGERKDKRGRIVPTRGRVPYGSPNAANVLMNFARTKLTPAFGTTLDLLAGENVTGEPVTPKTLFVGGDGTLPGMAPLSLRDIYDAMREEGVSQGAAIGVLSILGMGVQTYDERRPRHRPSGER